MTPPTRCRGLTAGRLRHALMGVLPDTCVDVVLPTGERLAVAGVAFSRGAALTLHVEAPAPDPGPPGEPAAGRVAGRAPESQHA